MGNSEWDNAIPITDNEWDKATPVSKEEWDSAKPVTEKGFLSHVWDDLVTRTSKAKEEILSGEPGGVFRATGQGAGFINDVVGEGMKSAYKTLMPDVAQEYIKGGLKSGMETDVGKGIVSGIKSATDMYGEFAKDYPSAAGNLEAATNIAFAVPVVSAVKAIPQGVKKGLTEVGVLAKESAGTIDTKLSKAIRTGIEKSIRPSVEGKRTFPQIEAYYEKADDAVKSIIENKKGLGLVDDAGNVVEKLPQTLSDFSQAVDSTKKTIFKQYDDMAKQAGGEGVKISLDPTVNELSQIAKNSRIVDLKPETAKYAQDVADRLAKRGVYTAEESQDAIAILNESLKAFYKNPSYETATKAYIDSLVANTLRRSLDESIEGAVGAGYQTLKNKYGSLKAIESDVNRRTIVDARKNTKGLVDFADILSGSTAAHAILSMNPALMGKAGAMAGIKHYIKLKNDPNRIVKGMFGDAEKLLAKREKYNPLSTSPVVVPPKRVSPDQRTFARAEAEQLAREEGQFGSLLEGMPPGERPPMSALEQALNQPEKVMATGAGDIDTALRIAPEELDAFRAAQRAAAGELKPVTAREAGTPISTNPTSMDNTLKALIAQKKLEELGLSSAAQTRRYDEAFGAGVRMRPFLRRGQYEFKP